MSEPHVIQPGSAPVPPRGSKAWFRDLHPFAPMDPSAPVVANSWLVPGLLMEGKINMMFGPEKSGKSRFLRYMMAHMYYQEPLWGVPTRAPKRLLYLAGEEQPGDITGRLMDTVLGLGLTPDDIPWGERVTIVQAAGMRMDRQEQRAWLRQELEDGEYDALFLDPLRRVHGARESSNDDMAYICNALREWSNALNITILVIHHTGKINEEEDDMDRIATWSRGASDVASVLDWATFVTRRKQHEVNIRRAGRDSPRTKLLVHDAGEGAPWPLTSGHP